jgi:Flp pilus assembly protein TadD
MSARKLEEAVKSAPSDATYHYHLGIIYRQLDDAKHAQSELQESINLDPNSRVTEKASRALGNFSRRS